MDLLQRPPPPPPVDIRFNWREAQILLNLMQNAEIGDSKEVQEFKADLFNTLKEGLENNDG